MTDASIIDTSECSSVTTAMDGYACVQRLVSAPKDGSGAEKHGLLKVFC